jgi:hypothetical protein
MVKGAGFKFQVSFSRPLAFVKAAKPITGFKFDFVEGFIGESLLLLFFPFENRENPNCILFYCCTFAAELELRTKTKTKTKYLKSHENK